jgi:hypothetical protein
VVRHLSDSVLRVARCGWEGVRDDVSRMRTQGQCDEDI